MAGSSAVRTARPTTWPPLLLVKARSAPVDALAPGLILLRGLDPADPFVPCERGDVEPRRQGSRVISQRLFQIRGKLVHDAAGDFLIFGRIGHQGKANGLARMSAMGGKQTSNGSSSGCRRRLPGRLTIRRPSRHRCTWVRRRL